jgi:GAF domain-containing protein
MTTLALDDVLRIMELSASQPDLQKTYAAIDALAQRTIGHKLFTVMRHLPESSEVERLYSSNTTAYPIAGRKPKQGTPWGAAVLDRGEVFIAADAAGVRAAFSDYLLIERLGISSIMNVPIRHCGRVLGTMNVNNDAGHFTPETVEKGKVLAALLVPLLLSA